MKSPTDNTPSDTVAVRPATGRGQLLIIDGDTSRHFALPGAGAVLIGRDESCDLVLRHKSASRRHARLEIAEHLSVVDLESHNGTAVNNVAINGRRRVGDGDVITVGDVVIVVQRRTRRVPPTGAIDEAEWRRRLAVEVERAGTYGRSVGVVAICVDAGEPLGQLAGSLRPIDSITMADDGQMLVLLPELDRVSVAVEARRAIDELPGARAGYASFPCDGLDSDTLLLAARSVARQAPAGAVWTLADTARRIDLGEHQAVLADPAMIRQFELIERLAPSDLKILVTGETGTGKEVAARAVHHFSNRAEGPFYAINCAAINETLVESTLFGYRKGAFTGATEDRPGLFESANGGTLFLDEIGELSASVQAKLLRVVESKVVCRIGEARERPTDVRLVAATNRDLEAEVEAGRFRKDLYFRLGKAKVLLPPLEQRRCEIPLLIREFLRQAGHPDMDVSSAAMRRLQSYKWDGSVRELKDTIEYAAALAADRGRIVLADLPEPLHENDQPEPAPEPDRDDAPSFRPIADEVRELEIARIKQALIAAGGVKTKAARLISMPIRTFTDRLKRDNIRYEDLVEN